MAGTHPGTVSLMPRQRRDPSPAPRRRVVARSLRTAVSTTLAAAALLGLPAATSDGVDVERLEETVTVVRELP